MSVQVWLAGQPWQCRCDQRPCVCTSWWMARPDIPERRVRWSWLHGQPPTTTACAEEAA